MLKFALYNNCDVYIRGNNIEWNGYDKNTTFEEMLEKAKEHRCCIITKNGRGKWYLKGLGKDYTSSREKLEKNLGKYPRIKCWLIEF